MIQLMRVAPKLPVADLPAALVHYEQQLGFDVAITMPTGDYAIVERDGVALHLFEDQARATSPGSIHIFTRGPDELDELTRRGARNCIPADPAAAVGDSGFSRGRSVGQRAQVHRAAGRFSGQHHGMRKYLACEGDPFSDAVRRLLVSRLSDRDRLPLAGAYARP